ncbi:hypothetical protein K488DRAFT_70602 [Vararia minispora EC-137]|uniref:Uncharacterized protein n=1 Tax=Vararia minispora EC-137 TaxID=1314806 RepID=A0ACB8QLL8_9AGAM|nr:hypothetical protein K488DRAFT_70602 [Vararia minispora EC-137]
MSSHARNVTKEHVSTPAVSQPALLKEPASDVRLLPDLDELWNPRPFLYDEDHAESLLTQLERLSTQPHEIPYYGFFSSTVVPRLCSQYTTASQAKTRFRLESESQSELIFPLSSKQRERIRDADFTPSASNHPEPVLQHQRPARKPRKPKKGKKAKFPPLNKEIHDLDENSAALSFKHRYVTNRGPPKDRSTPRTNPTPLPDDNTPSSSSPPVTITTVMTPTTPPVSEASSASDPAINPSLPVLPQDTKLRLPREERLIRYADGMIYIQERRVFSTTPLGAHRQRQPALCVELKVPTWPSDVVGPWGWEISGLSASEAISDALPQIVQQVQFIFNTHSTLSGLWACGVAGSWSIFYRFDRATTPHVDVNNLSKDHGYFHSAPGPSRDGSPTKYAQDIPVFETPPIPIVDLDGSYTDTFKRYWHLAMKTSEVQWDDKEPRDAAAARDIFDDLHIQIVPPLPTSRQPSQQADVEVSTS